MNDVVVDSDRKFSLSHHGWVLKFIEPAAFESVNAAHLPPRIKLPLASETYCFCYHSETNKRNEGQPINLAHINNHSSQQCPRTALRQPQVRDMSAASISLPLSVRVCEQTKYHRHPWRFQCACVRARRMSTSRQQQLTHIHGRAQIENSAYLSNWTDDN